MLQKVEEAKNERGGKSGRKKLREGEIESKTRGKHLRIEGSQGEGLRLGLRQDKPD